MSGSIFAEDTDSQSVLFLEILLEGPLGLGGPVGLWRRWDPRENYYFIKRRSTLKVYLSEIR